MVKRLLISFGGGLFLFSVWAAAVVATSQDFVHEGPHGVWYSPVEAWGNFLIDVGWSRWISSLHPVPGLLLGAAALFGPFVLALSAAFHLATRLLHSLMAARKFR